MKKLFAFLLSIAVLVQSTAVFAKCGDVNGTVYATDIRAFIDGVEVHSYNIGGKTAFVIEDVLPSYCYSYNDTFRTLIWRTAPTKNYVIEGRNESSQNPGTPIGKTYESDIKTYFGDKLIPTFALDGRMAVAIEDIAGDKVWSENDARFFWNDSERMISVEFIHDNASELSSLMNEKHLNADVKDGVLTVASHPFNFGVCSWDNKGDEVTFDGTVLGRYFTRNFMKFSDKGVVSDNSERFIFWDTEALQNKFADVTPVTPTRQQTIDYYTKEMSIFYDVKARLDTEDYTFMYLALVGVMHGGTELILRIPEKGETVNYADKFESVSLYGGKFFEDGVLDKAAKTFSFRYDTDYVLDLESGELKNI